MTPAPGELYGASKANLNQVLPASRRSVANRATLVDALVWLVVFASPYVFVEPAPTDILAVLFAALVLLSGAPLARRLRAPALLAYGLVVTNAASLFEASGFGHALFFAGITAFLLVLFGATSVYVSLRGFSGMQLILRAYVAGATIAEAIALAAFFRFIPWQHARELGRLTGTFKDPNVMGPFLIPAALYAFTVSVTSMRRSRLRWLALGLFFTVGIALSFSRAAWGTYALSLAAWAILMHHPSRWPRARHIGMWAGLVVLAVASTVVGAYLLVSSVDHPIAALAQDRAGIQAYDVHRFDTQRKAVATALRGPLGIGPGQAEQVLGRATQNTYLRVLVENGGLALAAYLGLFVGSIVIAGRVWRLGPEIDPRARQYGAILIACLVGLGINALVIDTLHWRHAWLLMGLAWGLWAYGRT